MDSFWSCFIVIVFSLTSLAAQDAGEIVVLRSPINGSSINFTCVADDDDAALTWTYGNMTDFKFWDKDFLPKKPPTKNNSECAVWKAEKCIAKWGMKSGWDFVNSTNRPMGPVLDYRWEDFAEFGFSKPTVEEKYRYVAEVQDPSRSMTFSARGEDIINIFLCETKEWTDMCFRIILEHEKLKTQVRTDENSATETPSPTKRDGCQKVDDCESFRGIIDGSEWRTFRIEWTSEKKTMKIFNNIDAEPLWKEIIEQKLPGSHVFVSSGQLSGVRFHFYQYLLAEKSNGELSTTEFIHHDKEFCVRLLVGLCPTCKIKIDVTDGDRPIGVADIISGNSIGRNGPIAWQPIKLTRHLEEPFPRSLHLRIQSFPNESESKGQWAIDNFRFCKSPGELRNSTVEFTRLDVHSLSRPFLNCQRLSYTNSTTVNPFSDKRNWDSRTSHLQQITNSLERLCNFSSSSSGSCAGWSICTSRGCTCDRGFSGTDCNQQCDDGSYGYGCDMRCGSCLKGYCDKKTGYCPDGNCKDEKLCEPAVLDSTKTAEVTEPSSHVHSVKNTSTDTNSITPTNTNSSTNQKSEAEINPPSKNSTSGTKFSTGRKSKAEINPKTSKNSTTSTSSSTDSKLSTDRNLLWLIIFPIMAISILAFGWYRNRGKAIRQYRARLLQDEYVELTSDEL